MYCGVRGKRFIYQYATDDNPYPDDAMTTKGKNSGNDAPARALTKMALQEFADERSFERGVRYFEEGRVTSLTEHRGEVIATVKLWVVRA